MRTRRHLVYLTTVMGSVACVCSMCAQQPVGSVSLKDATVTGALNVSDGRAQMLGSTTVTAGEHTAELLLTRGGTVEVCATSALHVTSGKSEAGAAPIASPLLLALDRGAVEVHMQASPRDALMTPDLRFGLRSVGPLDLHIRVTSNGDTCVENRGGGAPALEIGDQFGDGSYELRAGQHVLFEHGSLKEVVDHESSPCGCPAAPVVSVADAGTTSGSPATPGSQVSAASAQHPFPAAESQGLVPGSTSSTVPQAPAGVVHAQVAATLAYDAGAPKDTGDSLAPATPANARQSGTSVTANSASTAAPAAASTSEPAATTNGAGVALAHATAQAPTPEAPPSAHDIGHRIGRFFKRIFGRG